MKRILLTTIVTLLAGLGPFGPAHALTSRRIFVSCETTLMLRQRYSEISLKSVEEKVDALEALLAAYSSSGNYYAVGENEKSNFPTLILEKAGEITSVLQFLRLNTAQADQSQRELREMWIKIFAPHAELQVEMVEGLDQIGRAHV